MGALPNRKKTKVLLSDLRLRFTDGEKLSVDDIIKDYFSPKTAYSYLIAKAKVRGWLGLIKRQFKFRYGIWFGSLDDDGNFGILSTEAEVRFALMRAYRYVKGSVAGATLLVGDADEKGLLPDGLKRERFLLTRPVEEEDEA